MSDPIAEIFRKPFAAQLIAFRLRMLNLTPTVAWDDLVGAQHDRAFMVAGAMKADLLADLAKAIEKAITDGTTYETFRKDFRRAVERHGWHGWTGEGTKRGEEWRMRLIYDTNLQTSYMAGRHAQLVAGNFPFWVYRHGGSLEPRPSHLALDGLILPSDHPFWKTHFPPNDWGCSCEVFGALSMDAAIRVGGKPGVKLPNGWNTLDPKTGTAEGIGKGWDYAPGASVSDLINALSGKIGSWPPELAEAFLASLTPKQRAAIEAAAESASDAR